MKNCDDKIQIPSRQEERQKESSRDCRRNSMGQVLWGHARTGVKPPLTPGSELLTDKQTGTVLIKHTGSLTLSPTPG